MNTEDSKSIIFVAKSATERDEWKDAIEKAINQSKDTELGITLIQNLHLNEICRFVRSYIKKPIAK